jgi:pimeloyl-ACP methyl ester carboxylesterase
MHPVSSHSRVVRLSLLALLFVAGVVAGPGPLLAQGPDSHLLVYVNGSAIGTEDASVKKTPEGWQITGSGRLSPPLDLTTRRLSARYTPDWKPVELTIDATARGAAFTVRTTFAGGKAESDIVQLGQPTKKSDAVSADTLVLPNLFFATYEALAMRLAAMTGDTAAFAGYIAPQAEIKLEAKRLDLQMIETGAGTVRAHRYTVSFFNPGATLPTEIWTDDGGRLLRFEVPSQGLVVIREDIASVTARRQNISRPGDQSVTVPSNGFNLAGTLSQPKGSPDAKGRFPAIIMVPGSGPTDRDETVYGVPVFGQLAGQLADAGYVVLRFDKRGIGQSGGRAETADMNDFTEDVLAAYDWLRKRKDVDEDRIALVGHSEGAWVSLLAARRKDGIAAVVLIAGPSGTGADLVLEQQKYLLATMQLSEGEKQARVNVQKRIQAAVLGQGDWKDVPADLRQQADTNWFRTFLAFSPEPVLAKLDQPVLVIQGELDKQVLPHHADKLLEVAKARNKKAADASALVKVPGINHLLVPSQTGDVSEYVSMAAKSISPEVARAAAAFLDAQMPKR